MWHGLEIRVPFLDKDFLKTIGSIDASIKFKPSKGKHLLINAFKNELPQAVWDRAKQGFTLPFQEWMMHMPLKNLQPNTASFYSDFKKHKLHWSKLWLLEQLT
jgi:asparagine synthase (glutamine-hydrolysing)